MFEHLVKLIHLCGSDKLLKFHLKYGLEIPEDFKHLMIQKQPLKIFEDEENKHLCTEESYDLVKKLLNFDPMMRLTAEEALDHPFFKD